MATGGAVIAKGTYVFKGFVSLIDITQAFTFKSNGVTYSQMLFNSSDPNWFLRYDDFTVYTLLNDWDNEAYKTVVLETNEEVNINFYDWFKACFTLQEEPAITDLTGYTWECTSTDCTAGFGVFSVYPSYAYINGTEYSDEYTPLNWVSFYIGYFWNGDDPTPRANALLYMSALANVGVGDIITFAGGDDITNATLISWLEEHGTLTAPEEPSTDSVTITYGDKTITLTAGQKCTFKGGKVMQADIVAVVSASEEAADELQGTWVVNSSWSAVSGYGEYELDYTVSGYNYNFYNLYIGYSFSNNPMGTPIFSASDNNIVIHGGGTMNLTPSESFTINITSKLSEVTNGAELLTWLKANAIKQGEVALISFTISGTEYKAVDGMSWGEWVDNRTYNTDGYYAENTRIISPTGAHAIINQANEYVETTYPIIADGVYLYSTGGSN